MSDNKKAFIDWMSNYPDHKYNEATKTRYVNAMEKCDVWFGIKLPKKIFDITDYDEFSEVEKMLRGLSNFDMVNRSHGHGDLSAALKLYEKYLQDISDQQPVSEGGPSVDEPPKVLSPKEVLESIKRFIACRGFTYDSNLIENFYLSLKSKPFVILAGTSGTGKTRLVRLFAEAIEATSANGRYCQVAVRPDWSDSTDLFGYIDLNGSFVPGAILPFLKAATDDPKHPYILCLDEMNLARVEYYMSDFLSIIESRDFKDGKITSDLIMTLDKYGGKKGAEKKYGEIGFPQNLYIVGTVNMDETTFPFSRKVLDRANTIEFNYVNLNHEFSVETEKVEPYEATNDFLMSEYLVLDRDCRAFADDIKGYCKDLEDINQILQKANAHVGYRVRDEIVFYLLNNKKANLLPKDEAFDNAIMQKILPRIQGSSNSVRDMLRKLFEYFTGQKVGTNANDPDVVAAMQKVIDDSKKTNGTKLHYPKSAEKINFMVKRFEEDGFTSYWL